MAEKIKFDSKEELDNLLVLITNSQPKLPSEVLKVYSEIEAYISRIYKLGWDAGYDKGCEIKKDIGGIL